MQEMREISLIWLVGLRVLRGGGLFPGTDAFALIRSRTRHIGGDG